MKPVILASPGLMRLFRPYSKHSQCSQTQPQHSNLRIVALHFVPHNISHGKYTLKNGLYKVNLTSHVSDHILSCTPHPYIFTMSYQKINITLQKRFYLLQVHTPVWYTSFISTTNITHLDLSHVIVLKGQPQVCFQSVSHVPGKGLAALLN